MYTVCKLFSFLDLRLKMLWLFVCFMMHVQYNNFKGRISEAELLSAPSETGTLYLYVLFVGRFVCLSVFLFCLFGVKYGLFYWRLLETNVSNQNEFKSNVLLKSLKLLLLVTSSKR